uniref:BTB domain-containing protein n=1 Tax=Glossina palpalis gambiensis TaxID=67801 RepID=A0A1B0BV79_9MUSC
MQQQFILSSSCELKLRSFDAMNEMRKKNLLCDVTLVVKDMEIPAHKIVLASYSPYFYAMFTGFEESRQDRIILQGVDRHALELLIEYVYTSTVEVKEDNVEVLLTAAKLLQLTDVRDACCDYLRTQLDASNCLGIRDFSDMHGCVDLINYDETYIEKHFNEVTQFDKFLNLTHEQVIGLISNDHISVSSEERVYECVINWLRYDIATREQYTADLMKHVRLPFLAKEYITQKVDKEPLLQGNVICKNLIIEALTYHLLPSEIKPLDASNSLGIRDFSDMHGCVDLVNYAETYVEKHFNEVTQFDKFLNLTREQVIGLISNDHISVSSEERVYECVINWLRYDIATREQYTADLMKHVLLPFLAKEYIRTSPFSC